MQAFITLTKPFLSIAAQRAGPEVLPKSQFLLTLIVGTHIVVYFAGMRALDAAPGRAVSLALLDTVTQCVFFSALLLIMGFRARLVQTLTAVFGADIVLNLVSLPLAMMSAANPPEMSFPVLASILVLLWSLGVKGHILQRAVGVPYFVGVVSAAGFLVAFYVLDFAFYGAPV